MHFIIALVVGFILLLKLCLVLLAFSFVYFSIKEGITEKSDKAKRLKAIKVVRFPDGTAFNPRKAS